MMIRTARSFGIVLLVVVGLALVPLVVGAQTATGVATRGATTGTATVPTATRAATTVPIATRAAATLPVATRVATGVPVATRAATTRPVATGTGGGVVATRAATTVPVSGMTTLPQTGRAETTNTGLVSMLMLALAAIAAGVMLRWRFQR